MLTRTRKAFTLLELIVVIVILGILALLAIPTFQKVIDKTKKANVQRAGESIDRELRALAAYDQKTDNKSIESYLADMTNGTTDLPSNVFISQTAPAAGATVSASTWTPTTPATGGDRYSAEDGTFYVEKDGFVAKVVLGSNGAVATVTSGKFGDTL